jgi:hypothetical protein
MRDESRGVWLSSSLDAVWHDITHTLRALRRTPTFAIGVTLTLGLGLGANAAMFSLVDRLLFRPPARMIDPSTVHRVYLYRTSRGVEAERGGQYARYKDLAAYSTHVSQVAAFSRKPLAVGTGQDTQIEQVAVVSANFFGFFDAPPALGRCFTSREDTPDERAPVAVLSYDTWKTEFGGRPGVIGTVIQIDAAAYTIIGVAPDARLTIRDARLDSAAKRALRLRLLDLATSIPGVSHATLQESVPIGGMTSYPVFVTGIDSTDLLGEFDFNTVSADYFATMGPRILRGRAITSADIDGAPRAAVVGQSMANVLWPGQDPIGKCMRVGLKDTVPCTYVVGVAEDIHSRSIEPESKLYYYYLSAAQWRPQVGGLFIRARNAKQLVEPLRRRLQREP